MTKREADAYVATYALDRFREGSYHELIFKGPDGKKLGCFDSDKVEAAITELRTILIDRGAQL